MSVKIKCLVEDQRHQAKVIIKVQTYLAAGQDQASTYTVLPATGTSLIINYFKRPAEKSANVGITEEPLTGVPQVEIEDEEDENMNDNIAPIFQRNKVMTTIESTKKLISEKRAPDGHTKSTSSIYCKWETKCSWAYFSLILKMDGSVKLAKSIQTLETHIGKLSLANTINT